MITFSSLWAKLRNRKYRKSFVASHLKRDVPFQIRAMRKKLKLTQQDLAERSGLPQGTISRCENPNYGKLSFSTVLAIADGFDCAFVGRFVPFSDLTRWHDNLSEEFAQVATFTEEDMQHQTNTEDVDRAQVIPIAKPRQGILETSKLFRERDRKPQRAEGTLAPSKDTQKQPTPMRA